MTDGAAVRTVGMVGVGAMGSRMARNLLKHGFKVVAYDVSPERLAELAPQGAEAATGLADVAERAECVITMLPNLEVIESTVLGPGGLAETMPRGRTYIDTSTSSHRLSRRLAAALRERGIAMLDAPVSGTTPAAEDATLLFMVGGDQEVLERHRPVLAAMGTRIIHCGETGQGNAMKVVVNLALFASQIGGLEAMALGTKAGLNPRAIVEAITSGAADSYIFRFKADKILRRDWVPGANVEVGLKDVELAADLARDLDVPVLVPPMAIQLFTTAKRLGLGQQDSAAIITLYEQLLDIDVSA